MPALETKRYARAKSVLSRPSKSVRLAIEERKKRDQKAREEVLLLLTDGADARQLYENETDKARRVALLGFLRRGMKAL